MSDINTPLDFILRIFVHLNTHTGTLSLGANGFLAFNVLLV